MPLFARARPEPQLVDTLTHYLKQVIEVQFQVDDRVPSHLMPADSKLKPKIFVKGWTRREDNPDMYGGIVQRGPLCPLGAEPDVWTPRDNVERWVSSYFGHFSVEVPAVPPGA